MHHRSALLAVLLALAGLSTAAAAARNAVHDPFSAMSQGDRGQRIATMLSSRGRRALPSAASHFRVSLNRLTLHARATAETESPGSP